MDLSNLIGKAVNAYFVNMDEQSGVLSSFTNDGVMIKTSSSYCFYPWQEVTCIEEQVTPMPSLFGGAVVTGRAQKKKELNITCSDEHLNKEKYKKVEAILPEDYEIAWDDGEEDFTVFTITDDDGEEALRVDLDADEITCFYEKDFDFSKKVAQEIEVYNLKKDFQDEE